jgi:hypothetical protein
MKKIVFLLLLCLSFAGLHAQQTATKTATAPVNGPEIKFEKLYFDFGTLNVGDVKEVTVTFTNIGNKPLILDDVISSCDCTKLEWSKAPVMPGKTGTIKAKYTAENSGVISKRVTVLSNAETYRVILHTKGTVK